MAGKSHPAFKRARLETSKTNRVQRIHAHLFNHKELVCKALEQLESDWAGFCFVKILFCNADKSCSFDRAYCETRRNVQENDADKRRVIWIPDLFSVSTVQGFLDNYEGIGDQLLHKHLTAFEKLAKFLDTISDTNKVLHKQLRDESLEEGQWATIFATHVIRKLAVYSEMTVDSSSSGVTLDSSSSDLAECPCECKTVIKIGDNSMGHENIWHGSVSIVLGPRTASTPVSLDDYGFSEICNSAFDFRSGELEKSQTRYISKSIIFAFAMRGRVVPLVAISKTCFKIYMYNRVNDLLYESTTMPLFVESVDGRELHQTSLIFLWMVINQSYFFKGVQTSHVEFNYKANLQDFLGEKRDIYQNHIQIGGLRHVGDRLVKFIAGMNKGKFLRF